MGDLDAAPGSWLWPGHPGSCNHLENEPAEIKISLSFCLSPSLCVCYFVFQTNESLKEMLSEKKNKLLRKSRLAETDTVQSILIVSFQVPT